MSDFLCPICYNLIKNNLLIKTSCNHLFCNKCITLWKSINYTCPLCRNYINLDHINLIRTPVINNKYYLSVQELNEKLEELNEKLIEEHIINLLND